jgi:hypothetical protein
VVVGLGSPALCPLLYTRQVFQGNLALGGACGLDKPCADGLVYMVHMLSFTVRQPFQEAFGPLRAFGLERTQTWG